MKFSQTFKNKKVIVTGHTGFKGSWLAFWLAHLGANVSGISLGQVSQPSNFEVSKVIELVDEYYLDIRDTSALKNIINQIQPDFIFHLAAQSLVLPSYTNPIETLTTNAIGSANILEGLRGLDKNVVAIMITSDKAYDNLGWAWGYRETDKLGGKDPYSASKGMTELAIRSYIESFFNSKESNVRIGITRAGNVIGGGDWAVDRIVPDCVRAWSNNEAVEIRSPNSTRPWQHVLEPLGGYLKLCVELSKSDRLHGEAYNFGPPANQNHSVAELIEEMGKHWENVRWDDTSNAQDHLHEAGLLKLNCDKALHDLYWLPSLDFKQTVEMTVKWYRDYYENSENMHEYSLSQIEAYSRIAGI
jgi:CDP-glucose 4,6-dehydratase